MLGALTFILTMPSINTLSYLLTYLLRSLSNEATNLVYGNSVDVGVINEPNDLV